MRPKSWLRFWYGVARLTYILVFAPSMMVCVTLIFTYSVMRFVMVLAYKLLGYVSAQIFASFES